MSIRTLKCIDGRELHVAIVDEPHRPCAHAGQLEAIGGDEFGRARCCDCGEVLEQEDLAHLLPGDR